MKTKKTIHKVAISSSLSFLLCNQSVFGGLTYIVETDTNGDFVPGAGVGGITNTWNGNGTVQANVAPDPVAGTDDTLVEDFSGSGTLGLGNVQLRTGDPRWFDPQGAGYNFANSGVGWSFSVTLGSGTGDIILQSPVAFIGNSYQHFTIGDLQGVDSVTVEFNFDTPIAPVRAFTAGVPFIAGVRSRTDGLVANTTATFLNPIVLTDNDPTSGVLDISAASGFPSTSDLVTFGPGVSGWTNSASHSWDLTGSSSTTDFAAPAFLDLDGDGVADQPDAPSVVGGNANDGNLDEIERFYATGMRFEFTPDGGGTFANGSEFQFSTNGAQYEDSLAAAAGAVVPEPSSSALLAGGVAALMLRRKR